MTSIPIEAPDAAAERMGARQSSLLVRIAVTLVALLLSLGAVLFIAVDRLITHEFGGMRLERSLRQAEQLRRFLDADLRQIRGQAVLAATDSDLVHSTQYHVRLRGEAKAAQQDVERIAQSLDFPRAVLSAENGDVIAEYSNPLQQGPPLARQGSTVGTGAPSTRAVWHDERLWVVAESIVQSEGMQLARLQVARPAAAPLSARGGDEIVRAVAETALIDAGDLSVQTIAKVVDSTGNALRLELVSDDRSITIVNRAKQTLLGVFVGGCALAAAVMVLFLRREMRALADLTRAVAAVGRGDFRPRVTAQGAGEIVDLARAFNSMAEDLGRLRGMERELREQEKITALGRLATRLAHDINNPLTVIKNAALMMQRRGDMDEQASADLGLIVHHSGRCATILENLLLFGRPLRLRPQDLELAEFCRGVIERARLRQPGGHWVADLPAQLLIIRADAHQLEQMLESLLNNAYEAAGDAPIQLGCGLRDGRPFLQVRDQGSGFSPEARGHLFELFYTTKKHGTGIGLANASAIARAHGGDLVIENDGGAVVRVEFPLTSVVAVS